MNFLDYYQTLPDVPTYKQSELAFALFFNSELAKNHDPAALEILQDLADRHWHTYQFASDKTRQQVSSYLIQQLNLNDENEVTLAMQIACALGLKDVYEHILQQATSAKIKQLIKEFQSEMIEISDPYADLKRLVPAN